MPESLAGWLSHLLLFMVRYQIPVLQFQNRNALSSRAQLEGIAGIVNVGSDGETFVVVEEDRKK